MKKQRSHPTFLSGVPELLILNLLAGKPMYGYELVKAIKASTGDALEFGEGCIYPILHRLEADGQLRATEELAQGRSRLVYRVTSAGRKQLSESVSRWESIVAAVTRSLQGGDLEQPVLA